MFIGIERYKTTAQLAVPNNIGCAVGDGLLDWKGVFELPEEGGFDGVVTVECGDLEEAERSYKYLRSLADSFKLESVETTG